MRRRVAVHYAPDSKVHAQCGQSLEKVGRRRALPSTDKRSAVACVTCIKLCRITKEERGAV